MINKKRMSAWIWILIILVVVGIGVYFWLTGDFSSIPKPPAFPSG